MSPLSSASQKPQSPPPVWKYGPVVERVADVGGAADVELAALDAAAAAGRDERGARR